MGTISKNESALYLGHVNKKGRGMNLGPIGSVFVRLMPVAGKTSVQSQDVENFFVGKLDHGFHARKAEGDYLLF